MQAATEIVPGRLFAIGGWLALRDHRLSWVPDDACGFLPVNAFVLRDAGEWLLIDTGLPVHREEIAAGVAATASGCEELRVILTRREADCMLNLPWIIRAAGVREVLYAGALDPLDFFQRIEDAEISGRLGLSGATRTRKIADGSTSEIGTLRIEVLRTEMRLLSTNWLYEQVTQTLFSSDSFSFVTATAPHCRVASETAFDPTVIAQFLSAKMDWLIGIDPLPIIIDLDRLEASRPIARICPGFGCVIEGTQAVSQAFTAVREALRILGARARPPALGDFLKRAARSVDHAGGGPLWSPEHDA